MPHILTITGNGVTTTGVVHGDAVLKVDVRPEAVGTPIDAEEVQAQLRRLFGAPSANGNGHAPVAEAATYPKPAPAKKAAPAKKVAPAKKTTSSPTRQAANGYTMPDNFAETVAQFGKAADNKALYTDAYPDIPWAVLTQWVSKILKGTSSAKPASSGAKADRERNTDIRAYAGFKGLDVAARGRISGDVVGQYEAALRDGSWPPATA